MLGLVPTLGGLREFLIIVDIFSLLVVCWFHYPVFNPSPRSLVRSSFQKRHSFYYPSVNNFLLLFLKSVFAKYNSEGFATRFSINDSIIGQSLMPISLLDNASTFFFNIYSI
jgi:hypothetical protein